MNMWVEFFRPVLIVLQLLGFSFGFTPTPPVRPQPVSPPQTRPFEWTPEARSDFIVTVAGLVAVEGICRLRYDQAGLAAFIERTVPSTDRRFFGDLARSKRQVVSEVKRLPETEKTLFCLHASRSAKDFGFLR